MTMPGFNLHRRAALSAAAVVSAYTEQGVTADGTQKYASASKFGADNANSIFGFSMTAVDPGHVMCPIHFGIHEYARGRLNLEFPAAGQVRLNFDVETIGGGTIILNTPIGADGGRVHALVSTYYNGSAMEAAGAIWDATNGWQTATTTATGTAAAFTTSNGNVSVLNRSGGTYNVGTNDIYRVFGFHGVNCDPTSAADRNKFYNGAELADPTIAHGDFGAAVFDYYGDASDWNTNNFAYGAAFTKSGNPFVDV